MFSWFIFNLPFGWDLSCRFRVLWKSTGFYWGTLFIPIMIQEICIPFCYLKLVWVYFSSFIFVLPLLCSYCAYERCLLDSFGD